MQFTSISERRRSHHDHVPTLTTNPVLDYLRDGDDDSDPWGTAMRAEYEIWEVAHSQLFHGAEVVGDLPWERVAILEAIGYGIKGPIDDGPYTWPTLVETTAYDDSIRHAWLDHAAAVMSRRESFALLMGLSY